MLGAKGLLSVDFVRTFAAIHESSDNPRDHLHRIVWFPDQKRAFVRSDSQNGYYHLEKCGGVWTCSCPGCFFSKGPSVSDCKHISQVSGLQIGVEWPEDLDVIRAPRR